MKKLLLGLGALAAVVTPVATVVACGSTTPDKTPPATTPDKTPPKATTTWEAQRDAEVTQLEARLKVATDPHEKQGINAMLPILKGAKTEAAYKAISSHSNQNISSGLASDIEESVESLQDYKFNAPAELTAIANQIKAVKDEDGIKTIMASLSSMGVTLKDYATSKFKIIGIWHTRFEKLEKDNPTTFKNSPEYKQMIPFYKSLVAAHDKASVDEILSHFNDYGSPKR